MPSSKSAPKKKTPTRRAIGASKPSDEIKDRDLDKVTGGHKLTDDPCAGGEQA